MSKSNNLAEKLILFAVFFVFAVLVVAFAYGWDDITGKIYEQDDTASFMYTTSSKSDKSNGGSSSVADGGIININTATVDELEALPGVGKTKAKAIVEYREENGGFQEISDIKKVSGIGDGIFENIKDLITVG